ncbi:glycosyl hydrolase family 18 protein, partial [Gaiella sp.]|uniref:glycosyl hydrolase family 18 protein n=1 Tax=Gaiella sp. TaxID=2663207 RepID=UPI00398356CC
YFDCVSDGSFRGRDDPLVTGWARLRGIRVHARWNCQSTATLTRILRDAAVREATISGIVSSVVSNGYDGANIDFEAGAAADRDVYTTFIRDLAARLHGEGKQISIDVSAKFKDVRNHPRSTFYDYDALSQHADVILVMAWGIHWATSTPGAIDDLPWVVKVADYVAARPRRDRFVLGFGLYGFDWAQGGGSAHPGTPLEHEDIVALAARVGATTTVDPTAQAPTFRYIEADGTPHEVWYVDAVSLNLRLEVARSRGLNIALWRLGREDRAIWSLPAIQP